MASSSSSSQPNLSHLLLNPYSGAAATAAPPPTPSTQHPSSTTTTITTATSADALARLLHRLPPTLTFPTRRLSPRATPPKKTSHLPTISSHLSCPTSNPTFSSSALELGYFQLGPLGHPVSPPLAALAESDSLSLLQRTNFPREISSDWPFGHDHDHDNDNDDNNYYTTSFSFPTTTTTTTMTTTKTMTTSLVELARGLEKVGLEVVEKLASSMGFENPFKENGSSSSMMWVSLNEGDKTGRVYPYVVGLEYQVRARKWSLVSDSGSVWVEPEVGSILVTFGDIAQVWSNGKVKKVRGRPTPILEDNTTTKQGPSQPHCISMTMLLTLPLESMVSPLLLTPTTTTTIGPSRLEKCREEDEHDCRGVESNNGNDGSEDDSEDNGIRVFNSFSFEDYAWRVYHERLHFKDTLDRYRRFV